MEYIERIAEKIVPIVLLGIVGALFTMYMDVQSLKATAKDYKARADKAHDSYELETRTNRENIIRLQVGIK